MPPRMTSDESQGDLDHRTLRYRVDQNGDYIRRFQFQLTQTQRYRMKQPNFSATLLALLIAGSLASTATWASKGADDNISEQGRGCDDNPSPGEDNIKSCGGSRTDDNGKSGIKGKERSRYEARLGGAIQPGAQGKVELDTKPNKQRFVAQVKLPIPSAALAINDLDAATDASVTLSLSRGGVEYANCDLDLDKPNVKRAIRRVEYKVDILSRRGGAAEPRMGACFDASNNPVLPVIEAGDTADVSIDTYAAGPFLNGSVIREK